METGSIVKDLRDLLQDIVAPEVKALAAEMRGVRGEIQSLRHDMESRDERLFNAIERASLRGTVDLQSEIGNLRERVARLEATRGTH